MKKQKVVNIPKSIGELSLLLCVFLVFLMIGMGVFDKYIHNINHLSRIVPTLIGFAIVNFALSYLMFSIDDINEQHDDLQNLFDECTNHYNNNEKLDPLKVKKMLEKTSRVYNRI